MLPENKDMHINVKRKSFAFEHCGRLSSNQETSLGRTSAMCSFGPWDYCSCIKPADVYEGLDQLDGLIN